ncbi:hypothetical protein CQW23_22664 [Capsicum baccatum]|uniref:FBD domain-containing protein n=1 Tax=Capsicum baccatum TaxID=33114 RepID=A0A2G2W1J4_CAPBA|nr:hypothetical protein CQW23_22664 [Capsicum baccatum]
MCNLYSLGLKFGEVDYPLKHPFGSCKFLGSCNGLICLTPMAFKLMLWNPCTGKYKEFQDSYVQSVGSCYIRYGFGYDVVNDDYKVVKIFSFAIDEVKYENVVKIYSLRAKSLRELVLEYCNLMPVSLSSGVVNCNCLRKLSLLYVTLDEHMLQTLLKSCPLIVSFILNCCLGLEKIELLNLQKIKSVSIRKLKNQRVKIEASTLEHLSYSGFSEGLDVVECQNLKYLELSDVYISDGFLQHLISRSQFLESLMLDGVSCWSKRFNTFKSQSLKILKIVNFRTYFGIKEIDAPNLVSIECKGSDIPELKFPRVSSQLKHSKIVAICRNNVNAAWFGKLRKFLSNFTTWSQVSLDFSGTYNSINMNDSQLHLRVATPQVDVLNVDIRSSWELPTFVDALLLTCRPKRLNLHSSIKVNKCFISRLISMKNSRHSTSHGMSCHPRRLNLLSSIKMNKCFISRLMSMKNSRHSSSHEREPWHSQLIEIKAFDMKNQPLKLTSEELAISNLTEKKKVYFLLDWQCS